MNAFLFFFTGSCLFAVNGKVSETSVMKFVKVTRDYIQSDCIKKVTFISATEIYARFD